jgi:hypothetical protein
MDKMNTVRWVFINVILFLLFICSNSVFALDNPYYYSAPYECSLEMSNIVLAESLIPPSHNRKGDINFELTTSYWNIQEYGDEPSHDKLKDISGYSLGIGLTYGYSDSIALYLSLAHVNVNADSNYISYSPIPIVEDERVSYDGTISVTSTNAGIAYIIRVFDMSFTFFYGMVLKYLYADYDATNHTDSTEFELNAGMFSSGQFLGLSISYPIELFGIIVEPGLYYKTFHFFNKDSEIEIIDKADNSKVIGYTTIDFATYYGFYFVFKSERPWYITINFTGLLEPLYTVYSKFDMILISVSVGYRI